MYNKNIKPWRPCDRTMTYQATNSVVSREEEPPHTSHHGAREISMCKNKEYKKAKSFIWIF